MADTAIRESALAARDPADDETLSPSSSTAVDRVRGLLILIAERTQVSKQHESVQSPEELCNWLRELHVLLIDSSHRYGRVKDDFRRADGLGILLDLTERLPLLWAESDARHACFEILKLVFAILTEALIEHRSNLIQFAQFRGSDGWVVLQSHLLSFHRKIQEIHVDDFAWQWKLLDLIFALALRENGDSHILDRRREVNLEILTPRTESKVRSRGYIIWVPEAITFIMQLWNAITGHRQHDSKGTESSDLSLSILSQLIRLAEHCHLNSINLTEAIAGQIFFDKMRAERLDGREQALLKRLRNQCFMAGLTSSNLVLSICKNSLLKRDFSELLQIAAQESQQPPHIVFDLSLHGYASLDLGAIRSVFPPQESAGGYTVLMWLRIDEYDENCHTILFGALDNSQERLILMYLERDTRRIVLQTSAKSDRPSIRFKSPGLSAGRWHHIAIVHQRRSPGNTGKAFLFIDGALLENVKCPYPCHSSNSPPEPNRKITLGTPPTNTPLIHLFIGTPQHLAPRLGSDASHSRWSAASFQLVSRPLPEELVMVYKSLGPNYIGTFQDSLGSFQTYETSTELNIMNERLHQSLDEQSVIAKALKGRARSINSEENFYFNLIAAADLFHHTDLDVPGGAQSISLKMMQTVFTDLANSRNDQVDKKQAALIRASGGIRLTSVKPFSYHIWSICGGVSFAMTVLEMASSEESILQSVQLIFDLVKDNWKISEAFEREGGFPIMALLIRSKVLTQSGLAQVNEHEGHEATFRLKLLRLILHHVGHDTQNAALSVISNPLAYRALIVDSDIWRTAEGSSQSLYYQQYVDFIARSGYAAFNIRRLSRMSKFKATATTIQQDAKHDVGLVKRLMNALKSDQIQREGLYPMLETLKSLLLYLPSSEAFRATALYITFAVSTSARNAPKHLHITSHEQSPIQYTNPSSNTVLRPNEDSQNDRLPLFEVGLNVLNTFAKVLLEDKRGIHLRKFARTVTNRWLLYLLSCEHESIVGPTMQILARLLVLQGPSYVSKFQETSSDFKILAMKLRRWWFVRSIWECLFAVLFGVDPFHVLAHGNFESSRVYDTIMTKKHHTLYCPAIFSVMVGLFEVACSTKSASQTSTQRYREGSQERLAGSSSDTDSDSVQSVDLIVKVMKVMKNLYISVPAFSQYCAQPTFIQQMMRCIFAGVTGVNSTLSPGDEAVVKDIHSMESTLHSEATKSPQMEPAQDVDELRRLPSRYRSRRRRQSSFVLVPTKESIQALTESPNNSEGMPVDETNLVAHLKHDDFLIVAIDLLLRVLCSQVVDQKDFTGLGLFHKAPPSSSGLRASVNSYLICKTMVHLEQILKSSPDRFHNPKTLMNVVRYSLHAFDAYMEGWFVYGALDLIKFDLDFLRYWERPEVQAIKDVRLCNPSLRSMRATLGRTILFHVIKAPDSFEGLRRLSLVASMLDGTPILASPQRDQDEFCGPLLFAVLRLLPEADVAQSEHARRVLSTLLDMNIDDTLTFPVWSDSEKHVELLYDLQSAVSAGKDPFQSWLFEHMSEVQTLSLHAKDAVLMPFVAQAEHAAAASAESRSTKRKGRVEQWHLDDLTASHMWTEHQIAARNWSENIARSEGYKYARSIQDQHESHEYLRFNLEKLKAPLERLGLAPRQGTQQKWQLEECEGRDRMRLRLSPLDLAEEIGYEPKTTKTTRRKTQSISGGRQISNMGRARASLTGHAPATEPVTEKQSSVSQGNEEAASENYELVVDQKNEDEDDKNRKVMRSLQRGEQVTNAFNVARIVGLEAHEGLLIVGKSSLYLVDGLFQRADGEVVNVDEAPPEELDQYTRILSGHEVESSRLLKRQFEPTRHWPWSSILSFSKRHFLTRPVAIEVFFIDGRSYLLITSDEAHRNALYNDILQSASKIQEMPQVENEAAWRKDLLKNPSEGSSKLASILSPMVANPMTKKWIKGEVSNFHYLMWINSQAGRTFNDLTQYPVFPWVLADYTSEELDLSNPRSFRDLSKPMGCQTIERSESFKERYSSLAEMDEHSPPFHYGTHYSSAMIVTSFLIRLQPFTQSHVLLQGGSFDHANRLFHSIEQDWRSASREGLSDVRELIPEFFYLPDFLVNVNRYSFGYRQGDHESVDHVKLPPWAKGSPEIFIAKHREALESTYVSQNLHAWIDLIFGFKQRGEAAQEATNVFHYLSYPGAKDLDTIEDQHERAATIGIIHNFGQTPRQIFLRPHDRREQGSSRSVKLREGMRNLGRLRSPTHRVGGGVSALYFFRQLVAAGTSTCHCPPSYDLIADFGYRDHSLRVWNGDHQKQLGLREQLHDGAITAAVFADSSTLLTGGGDTTAAAWTVHTNGDSVELHLISTLFGHRAAVQTIAVSRAFSVVVSASHDGNVILWDLGRLEFIRSIDGGPHLGTVTISDSSGRILVSCGANVRLYTINGRILLDQRVCDVDETITAIAFYQQSTSAWFDSEVVITGHSHGVVKIWELIITAEGKWVLDPLNRLPTDRFIKGGETPAVTALLARESKVYAGDEMGWVYEWNAVK
ncbi:MAG: hypothetical protein Q9159_006421 [Coniocarpon cinnabarinum]